MRRASGIPRCPLGENISFGEAASLTLNVTLPRGTSEAVRRPWGGEGEKGRPDAAQLMLMEDTCVPASDRGSAAGGPQK